MALSNKFGWLVLATGNKSEMSVGYATLYGDMAGGFAVLKDVYKGRVYELVRWRNEQAGRELVPASVLDRPPSAELRHEQRDDESLPPYDVLDAILEGYIEEDLDAIELVHRGLPAGGGGARDPDGRPRRVQAPPGAARHQDLDQGVRPRPAAADHEPPRVHGRALGAAPAGAEVGARRHGRRPVPIPALGPRAVAAARAASCSCSRRRAPTCTGRTIRRTSGSCSPPRR